MAKKQRKKLKYILLISITVISLILYMLADRYLIEHVEGKVTDDQTTTVTSTSATPDATASTGTASGTAVTTTSGTATESTGTVKSDDWNYVSDNTSISIKKVQTGTGKNTVTYYVADVQLKDATSLKSAFAKNSYGRNIVQTTSEIASSNNAIFAINGDYYGFRNDGVLIRNGKLYRDVPARTGAAFYKDGTLKTYDEKAVSSSTLLKDGVLNTLSFGPVLVENGQVTDFSGKVVVDTNFGNRSIQDLNPRTGVGMISPNHYVFIVVDGRSEGYSKGMTLTEFANLFKDLGCTEAYNIDGGGSSTMYFNGRVVNNPLGKNDEREISDILYING